MKTFIALIAITLISLPAMADAAGKCRIGSYKMYRNAYGENFARVTWACNRDRGYDSIRANQICGTTDDSKQVCGVGGRIYEARSGTTHEIELSRSRYPLKRVYLSR